MAQKERVEETRDEPPRRRGGLGSTFRGILWGIVVCGIGFIALSVLKPLSVAPPDRGADEAVEAPAAEPAPAPAPATPAPEPEAESSETAESGTSLTPVPAHAPASPEPVTEVVQLPQIPIAGPALEVNARAFTAPDGAGLLSIVLINTGGGRIDLGALELMTMPLTLAIRPDGAEDLRLAQAARAAGHEVLAVLPLAEAHSFEPEGLKSSDAPDQLAIGAAETLAKMRMAVGAAAPANAEILTSHEAMAALLRPIAEHGFAWVEPMGSENSAATRLVASSNLSYARADETAEAGISMDQVYGVIETGAGLARSSGAAIVFVAASPDAFRAIVRWGLEKAGRNVVFAPLSAVIRLRGGG